MAEPRMFRVTAEDLTTGEKQVLEAAEGDYVLIPLDPCRLTSVIHHGSGTVQLVLKDHRPAAMPRRLDSEPSSSPTGGDSDD